MKLGFSLGCFYKFKDQFKINDLVERILDKTEDALELTIIDESELGDLFEVEKSLVQSFDYVSLHAPALKFEYANNEHTRNILNSIKKAQDIYQFDSIVVHPDRIKDVSIFAEFSGLPFAVENMDARKSTAQRVEQLSPLIPATFQKLVLDIQHTYTIDPTGALFKSLLGNFPYEICHFHLSGMNSDKQHDTFYEHEFNFDHKALPDKPIIVESVFNSISDLDREYDFLIRSFS
jgi:hypothetical protein